MSSVCVESHYAQGVNSSNEVLFQSKLNAVVQGASKKSALSKYLVLETLNVWVQRSHQRKQLAKLDQRLLEDVGLNYEMVKKEIAKPFWK